MNQRYRTQKSFSPIPRTPTRAKTTTLVALLWIGSNDTDTLKKQRTPRPVHTHTHKQTRVHYNNNGQNTKPATPLHPTPFSARSSCCRQPLRPQNSLLLVAKSLATAYWPFSSRTLIAAKMPNPTPHPLHNLLSVVRCCTSRLDPLPPSQVCFVCTVSFESQ